LSAENLTQLTFLLQSIRNDLDIVVENWEIIYPELKTLVDSAKKAWFEIRENIAQAEKQIEDKKAELRSRGLSGSQLDFKIQIFIAYQNLFTVEWQRYQTAKEEEKRTLLDLVRHFILRKLLKQGDIILDSLASIIPLLEPLVEFKETLENQT